MSGHILLINPNSSTATSAMMLSIAQAEAGSTAVTVTTAVRSPVMIVSEPELRAAEAEVIEIGMARHHHYSGIVVSAFGDPGLDELRRCLEIPVVGICESSMLEAAGHGRRFGIATTTPRLVDAIARRAADLGLSAQLTGIRCTSSDPMSLTADADHLYSSLGRTAHECIALDGAEAVIIGGGPLGQAAKRMQADFSIPIIAPIPSAISRVISLWRRGTKTTTSSRGNATVLT